MQTKYKRSCLRTFFSHFSLLQNPQKYSMSTSSLMIKIQLATLTDSQWSSTLGTQRGCLRLPREPERRGGGRGRSEPGPCQSRMKRDHPGWRQELGRGSGRLVGGPAGSPCPGLRQQGGSSHCEALPEWTEIFSSAHKGHFSLPQHNTAEPQ